MSGRLKIAGGVTAAVGGLLTLLGLLLSFGGIPNSSDKVQRFRVNMGVTFSGLFLTSIGLAIFKPVYMIPVIILLLGIMFSILSGYSGVTDGKGNVYVSDSHFGWLTALAVLCILTAVIIFGVYIYFGIKY